MAARGTRRGCLGGHGRHTIPRSRALLPFIISVVLAQLFYPVVVFLEKRLPGHNRMPGVSRIVSILIIYVAFAGVVAGVLYLTVPPLFAESEELLQTFPDLYERARSTVEGWSQEYAERIPVELRTQIEEAVAAGGKCWQRRVGASSNGR